MTARSSRRALVAIIATLGLALVIIVVGTVLEILPGTGTNAASPNPVSVSPPAQSDTDAATGTDTGTGSKANEKSPEGTVPTPIAKGKASEVLPAPEESSPLGLPPSPPLPDLVTLPLPPTASQSGALVAGYPADLIPPTAEATIISSSVASADNRLQVALAASTPLASDAVLEFYRVAFAANDLVDSVAPAASGSSALLFSRGSDTVLLTVTPTTDGGTDYSVYGAFTATK
jgi:hypothetical protein